MRLSTRFYACLLRTYPARLRQQFGDEMVRLFEEQLEEARLRRKRLYVRTLTDWFRSMPAVHFTEFRRRMAEDRLTPWHRLLKRGLTVAPNPAAAVWITAGVLVWCGVRKIIGRSERAVG